jgi:hypothetical protein
LIFNVNLLLSLPSPDFSHKIRYQSAVLLRLKLKICILHGK